jgi:DNA polymerase-4
MEVMFGKGGTHLWLLANGIDDRPVTSELERKSYSEETTFDEDVSDDCVVEQVLFEIADRLSRRIRREGLMTRTITLKIRLEGFRTFTRSYTQQDAVDDMNTIRSTAISLYRNFDREGSRVRLVGINVSNLEERGADAQSRQLELFSEDIKPCTAARDKDPEKLLDSMKDRFGEKVTRAAFLDNADPRK